VGLRDRLRDVARRGRSDSGDAASDDPFHDPFGIRTTLREPPSAASAPGGSAAGASPSPAAPASGPADAADLQPARDDLAGLVLEMARLGRFNHPVLERRAFEVLELEERRSIAATIAPDGGRRRPPRRGRREPGSSGLTRCSSCQAAVPADANFCAYCGTTLGTPW
jgi:hypothetical protein